VNWNPGVDRIKVDDAAQRLTKKLPPGPWAPWPGGWPDQIELAVLDAVFSIRAHYGKRAEGGEPATGVYRVLDNWRRYRASAHLNDLEALAPFTAAPDELLGILDNDSKTAGRSKAEVAADVAFRFTPGDGLRVRHAADFPVTGDDQQELRKRWVGTPGLGPVTWSYLCMLLGHPDVKADVMITRYLHRELDLSRAPTREEARTIVTEAAERLEMSSLDLDHAIWSFERTAANRQERSGPLANRRN
jgi:hypothetical protein